MQLARHQSDCYHLGGVCVMAATMTLKTETVLLRALTVSVGRNVTAGIDVHPRTFQRNTATGTTSSMIATFLSSSLHGSKQAMSLSYLTIQPSLPCEESGNGKAISLGLLNPQQENASCIRFILCPCFERKRSSQVSLKAHVKLPGGEMCVPAKVARTDSKTRKNAIVTWNILDV